MCSLFTCHSWGLAGNMRRHYPAPLLYLLVGLLVVANTINLGADLGAMAAALHLLIDGLGGARD